ncbi:hypothetical protein DPMN_068686 [Dreissena polymorpha]|uniref:Uncharacterized protein n=1 Tax=Dreissena polymorpha TaxID=45954 RepID=A0A9D3Z078_DREPO|nr:hypothetical protein DPMN_068686 [Dreissena polymorpha]
MVEFMTMVEPVGDLYCLTIVLFKTASAAERRHPLCDALVNVNILLPKHILVFVAPGTSTRRDTPSQASTRRKESAGSSVEKLDIPDRSQRSKSPVPDSQGQTRNRSRSPAPNRVEKDPRSRSPAPDRGHDQRSSSPQEERIPRSRSPAPDRDRTQRSRSPKSERGHQRSRSSASHQPVPDSVARSLSPTDLSR